jgi:hypothetical protein
MGDNHSTMPYCDQRGPGGVSVEVEWTRARAYPSVSISPDATPARLSNDPIAAHDPAAAHDTAEIPPDPMSVTPLPAGRGAFVADQCEPDLLSRSPCERP